MEHSWQVPGGSGRTELWSTRNGHADEGHGGSVPVTQIVSTSCERTSTPPRRAMAGRAGGSWQGGEGREILSEPERRQGGRSPCNVPPRHVARWCRGRSLSSSASRCSHLTSPSYAHLARTRLAFQSGEQKISWTNSISARFSHGFCPHQTTPAINPLDFQVEKPNMLGSNVSHGFCPHQTTLAINP